MCQICIQFRPADPGCVYAAVADPGGKRLEGVTGPVGLEGDPDGWLDTPLELTGQTFDGRIDAPGDDDWVAVTLADGAVYDIAVDGRGDDALNDSVLRLYDSQGHLVALDDDSGPGRMSQLQITAPLGGTYFVSTRGYADSRTGDYRITVAESEATAASLDQRAEFLTDGFWDLQGQQRHSFPDDDSDADTPTRLTVWLDDLPPDQQRLAAAALEAWAEVAHVTFDNADNSDGADIRFQNTNTSGPYALYGWIGDPSQTNYAVVNIPTSWVTQYGSSYDSYGFQTYIHEVGHALGLGHQGNYDGSASYPNSATFENDSWQTSVMSYFSQTENTTVPATHAHAITPMAADILAVQRPVRRRPAVRGVLGGRYGLRQRPDRRGVSGRGHGPGRRWHHQRHL